jgi:hypothetical protein
MQPNEDELPITAVTIYYQGGLNPEYDEALDKELGIGDSTDAGTCLVGPVPIRDIGWHGLPDGADPERIEQAAYRICGSDLVKIEYERIETKYFR